MFEYLYEWLRNLSFYLILVTAVTHVLPGNGYRKYIRFFTGLVLILMLIAPVCQLFQTEYKVTEIYEGYDFEEKIKGIEEEINKIEIDSGANSQAEIEVEGIVIGH